MMKNMKIGTKITLGFALVIAITLVLGMIAILSMNNVTTKAKMLANEYAPEAKVANNVERSALLTLFEMRGFMYTGEERFKEPIKKNLEDVKMYLKEASELGGKSANLGKLAEGAKKATDATLKYEELVKETYAADEAMTKAQEQANAGAAKFVKTANAYIGKVNQKLDAAIEDNTDKKTTAKFFEESVIANDTVDAGNTIRVGVWKAIATRDPKLFQEQYKNFDTINSKLDQLKKLTTDKELSQLIDENRAAALEYKSAMESFLKAWFANEELGKKRLEVGTQVTDAGKEVTLLGISDTINASQAAATTLVASLWVLIIGLIICVVVAVMLATFITAGINAALNRTTNSLGEASQQVASAAGQLSSASQQLSSSSSEQASSIEETSASLEEMSGMIETNLKSAEKAKELADNVKTVAETGNTAMTELVHSMKEILESNTKIENLVKVIGEIGEKTLVIDEIVFQTKLLSFNASVEAERAGEHGRGFAVVAQEVGNLAQMSGKAALEISSIVKQSIKTAEEITVENKKKVEKGNGLVLDTAKILKETVTNADTVSTSAAQVTNASREQASGIKQITTAMEQLNKATQENASISEEAASSSEELSAQAETLRKLVEELTAMVRGKGEGRSEPSPRTKAEVTKEPVSNVKNIRPLKKVESRPAQMAVGQNDSGNAQSNDEWEKL